MGRPMMSFGSLHSFKLLAQAQFQVSLIRLEPGDAHVVTGRVATLKEANL